MKKILVIGIKGMAGHMIYNYLTETNLFDVYGMARNALTTESIFNVDVSNTEQVKNLINEGTFDCIVN